MDKYAVLRKKIGRFRGVSTPSTDEPIYDTVLSGELGEIWEKGNGTLKAFKINGNGSEKIFSFSFNDLEKWIIRLKVPADPAAQLYWANNPNARHK